MVTRVRSAYLGEDVPIQVTYTDPATGEPIDPDDTDADGTADATITIEHPDGTEAVTGAAMTRVEIGTFEYIWDTEVDANGTGTYVVDVTAEFSGETDIERMNIPLE